ncbi:MAG: D-alanyl-D-alanine endopeptidase [Gammaproteobacteria bacterium]|nr:D-alanyl-D-alanine endopeptidase [Gammaproteobacteria bacterium]
MTDPAPQLASVSAHVAAIEHGTVLLAKRDDVVLPIASLTKLMSAIVVLRSKAPLDEYLTIAVQTPRPDKNAFSRLRVGSEATRGELLRMALMSSENRAGYSLAAHHPGGAEAFVAAMNETAAALGMEHSTFVDPTGLAVGNLSTARDLALMAAAAHGHGVIRDLSTTWQHTVTFRKPRYRLGFGNTNPLVASSRWKVELTKTGYLNEAGRCLVMVTEMDGSSVVVVLLNSFGKRSPLGDAGRIRRWLETGVVGKVAPAAEAHELRVAKEIGLE